MKVAFLDRDGVINKDPGYLYQIEAFEFTDGCISALKTLQSYGYQLIVVTNQSGIGRGYYSEADYQRLTQWYLEQLNQQGVAVMDVFHCPHTPDDHCHCRKPNPGLFEQAMAKYPDISIEASLMVGDKLSDLDAAYQVGVEQLVLIVGDDSHEEKKDTHPLIEKLQKKEYRDKVTVAASLQAFVRQAVFK